MISRILRLIVAALLGCMLHGIATAAPVYAGLWDTWIAPNAGDAINLLAPNQNLTFIQGTTNYRQQLDAIDKAVADNTKVVLTMQYYFFNGNQLLGSYPDYAALVGMMTTAEKAGIAALYVYDEPDTHGVTEAQLQIEVNALHTNFPGVPLMIVWQPGTYTGISLIDWAGIDCYSNGDWECQSQWYTTAYKNMRAQLTSSQHTVLVPQGGYPVSGGSPPCCDAALQSELQRYINLGIADPMVIAIIPFLYPNDGAQPGLNADQPQLDYYLTVLHNFKTGYVYPAGTYTPVLDFNLSSGTNHFNTTNLVEGFNANYNFFQIMYSVWRNEVAGTAPLYRCLATSGGHHFASRSSTCEGAGTLEETYGYVSGTQISGTLPLFRYYNSTAGDYYDSTVTTAPANYSEIGILGYVPGPALLPIP